MGKWSKLVGTLAKDLKNVGKKADQLEQDAEDALSPFQDLRDRFTKVGRAHNKLRGEFNELRTEHNSLKERFETLRELHNANNKELAKVKTDLKGDIARLERLIKGLSDTGAVSPEDAPD